ncbi:hypothetical protein [Rhodalgimonas zhirmunskyi]|uniref:Uncharacterized protein n=1 Tax=Rhodalgimonas zhirmunskyi TaxID=2964767 RepID=A0AAJ1X7H3_9RHOB|nr:hypothetical protein [Rhodoalgimonas zhirmunskyi]MDQ2094522.1 hypothetical protein [Rhodoalgimonas zhirmunskyi]
MHHDIYTRYVNREVHEPEDFEDEIFEAIMRLSESCRENILRLDTELCENDPDADERCGVYDLRYEVFAMAIPGCGSHRLIVSLDHQAATGAAKQPGAMMHGPIPQGANLAACCQAARKLVRKHRGLINPAWES